MFRKPSSAPIDDVKSGEPTTFRYSAAEWYSAGPNAARKRFVPSCM